MKKYQTMFRSNIHCIPIKYKNSKRALYSFVCQNVEICHYVNISINFTTYTVKKSINLI